MNNNLTEKFNHLWISEPNRQYRKFLTTNERWKKNNKIVCILSKRTTKNNEIFCVCMFYVVYILYVEQMKIYNRISYTRMTIICTDLPRSYTQIQIFPTNTRSPINTGTNYEVKQVNNNFILNTKSQTKVV